MHTVMDPYYKYIRSRTEESRPSFEYYAFHLEVQIDRDRRSDQLEEQEDLNFDFGLR